MTDTTLPPTNSPLDSPAKLHVHIPRPTAWPFLMALGVMLLIGSIVLDRGVAILGLALAFAGATGWFREVLPAEQVENFEVAPEAAFVAPDEHVRVRRIEVDETHRAQLPLKTFSIWSGVKGGIAGGFAMIIPAEVYGILRYHSIWYVVNLLGGAGVGTWLAPTPDELMHFRLSAFVTASIIQTASTLLIGMLYGALLPIWPRRPILLGGLIAPMLWTGLLHSTLVLVNPYLAQHIDWYSFAAAQVVFGVVAGTVVSRLGHLRSLDQMPWRLRLGVETPGLKPGPREPGGEK